MGYKDVLRKIIPVRASVFSHYLDESEKRYDAVTKQLAEIKRELGMCEKRSESRLRAVEASTNRTLNTLEAKVGSLQVMSYEVLLRASEQEANGAKIWDGKPCGSIPVEPEEERPSVIISLTSYPARIGKVHKTISTLLNQSISADKIILWLSYEEFPLLEFELPLTLKVLIDQGLTIRWCDNIGPHKKYYYTMREYPDSIIVTVDDDILYDSQMLERLLAAHKEYPWAICAGRARELVYSDEGLLLPYTRWRIASEVLEPRMDYLATGVGGVLYPPHSMDERLFNKDEIRTLCPYCDDLWLKTMQMIKGTPTLLVQDLFDLNTVAGTQNVSLYYENLLNSANDASIATIAEVIGKDYPAIWKKTS